MRARYMLAIGLALLPVAASASETVTYSYDAKGRLTNVAHVGGPAGGQTATYTLDPADNRINVTVSGVSPGLATPPPSGPPSTPSGVVVVPMNGFTLIPIN